MLHVDQCSSLSLREQALQCIVVFALALSLKERAFLPFVSFCFLGHEFLLCFLGREKL